MHITLLAIYTLHFVSKTITLTLLDAFPQSKLTRLTLLRCLF